MKVFGKLAAVCRVFLRPVSADPLYFVLIVLMSAAAPVSMMLIKGDALKHYAVYSASVGSVVAYLTALILLYVRPAWLRRGIKGLIYAVYGVFVLVETGCVTVFGTPLNVDMVGLVLETNPEEAGGCFDTYFSWKIVAVWGAAALMAAAVGLAVRRACVSLRRHKSVLPGVGLAVALMLVYGMVQILFLLPSFGAADTQRHYMLGLECHGERPDLNRATQFMMSEPVLKTADLWKQHDLNCANIAHWEDFQKRAFASVVVPDTTRNFDMVLVIGESFIRRHSSLYGYPLPTNPFLSAEREAGRLIVFTDMAAPANLTTDVMRNMLDLNDLSADELWYESAYFPALVKRAGWNVYHYDNQTVRLGHDNGISRLFYSDFNLHKVLDGVSDTLFSYDMPYVRHVNTRWLPRRKPGKSFVIYHLMGQHFPFSDRFEGEPVFRASDIAAPGLDHEERQMVADYDNATLYNDQVLSEIIAPWRDRPVILFYFSDHGEDVPDLGMGNGRVSGYVSDPEWVDRQFHIPFFVWMSDSFQTRYPELAEAVRHAAGLPGITDKFGYMVLGLTGASLPGYISERDMLSPDYLPGKRRTVLGFDYGQ